MKRVETYKSQLDLTRKSFGEENYTLNEEDFLKKLSNREKYTPDFHILRAFKEIPLFVFDELKKGFESHNYLVNAKYLGRATTLTHHYRMYTYRDKYPIVMESPTSNFKARVRGELYLVNVSHIHCIDILQDHTRRTLRNKLRVLMLDQPQGNHKTFRDFPWTEAFIYLGIPQVWEKESLQGYHTRTVRNKNIAHDEQIYDFQGIVNEEQIDLDNYREFAYFNPQSIH